MDGPARCAAVAESHAELEECERATMRESYCDYDNHTDADADAELQEDRVAIEIDAEPDFKLKDKE